MHVSYNLQRKSRSVSEVMCRCWFMELWKLAHELIHYSVLQLNVTYPIYLVFKIIMILNRRHFIFGGS